MLERKLYEQKLKEQDAQESEEEELRVFDDPHDQDPNPKASSSLLEARPKDIGKGKAIEGAAEPILNARKRRRPLVDPFAGMCTCLSSISLLKARQDTEMKPLQLYLTTPLLFQILKKNRRVQHPSIEQRRKRSRVIW